MVVEDIIFVLELAVYRRNLTMGLPFGQVCYWRMRKDLLGLRKEVDRRRIRRIPNADQIDEREEMRNFSRSIHRIGQSS